MAKTLYEQIAEEEAQLEQLLEKEKNDGEQGNNEGTEKDGKTDEQDSGDEEGGSEGEAEPEGGDDGESEDEDDGKEDGDREDTGSGDQGTTEDGGKDETLTPSQAAFAKQRRQLRDLQAQIADLKAMKTQTTQVTEQPKPEAKSDDPEPARDRPAEWMAWKIRQQDRELSDLKNWKNQQAESVEYNQTVSEAIEEFQQIAEHTKRGIPDFDKAMSHAKSVYATSLKITNPSWSERQIRDEVQKQLLAVSGAFAARGMDIGESLYDMAIERFGYSPQADEEPKEPAKPKVSVAKVAANKKRSATGLGSSSRSGNTSLTLEEVANMPLSQFSRLTPEQLRQLEETGR